MQTHIIRSDGNGSLPLAGPSRNGTRKPGVISVRRDGATRVRMEFRTSCLTSNIVSQIFICYSRIFRNGERMRAAECRKVGGNAWYDPSLPSFGGNREVMLFEEELKGSKYQNRLGKCYYFIATELEEKKRLWEETKAKRKEAKAKGKEAKAKGKETKAKGKCSGQVQQKGKGPEVVPPPNGVLPTLAQDRNPQPGSGRFQPLQLNLDLSDCSWQIPHLDTGKTGEG